MITHEQWDEAEPILKILAKRYNPNMKFVFEYHTFDSRAGCFCNICKKDFYEPYSCFDLYEHGFKHLEEHGLLILL